MQGYGTPVGKWPGLSASLAFVPAGADAAVFAWQQGRQPASPIEIMANIITNTIKALIIGLIVFSFSISGSFSVLMFPVDELHWQNWCPGRNNVAI
jgi:hypothetical protein